MNLSAVIRLFLVISGTIICFMYTGVTYAGDNNDCNEYIVYSADQYAQRVVDSIPQIVIFTKDDIVRAVYNLQQFCCYGGENLVNQTLCQENNIMENPRYYAESPFIVDHLRNIGMRKMDGIQSECDRLGISCDHADGYEGAVQRREYIRGVGEDKNSHPPVELMESFLRFWGDAESLLQDKKRNRNTGAYALLKNRYDRLCEEVGMIRKQMRSLSVSTSAGGKDLRDGGMYQICKSMTQDRMLNELRYVKMLMIEQGIFYVSQNLSHYMQTYFLQNRFRSLVQKYSELEGCFVSVLKKTTKTECCNQ